MNTQTILNVLADKQINEIYKVHVLAMARLNREVRADIDYLKQTERLIQEVKKHGR